MPRVSELRLGLVTEGPIARQGDTYYFSEGAGYYIERLAGEFDEVVILAFVLREGDPFFDAVAHYPLKHANISVRELPAVNWSRLRVLGKMLQMLRTWLMLWREQRGVDLVYIFLPGYNGALSAILCRLTGKTFFSYLASDWPEEAALLNPFGGGLGRFILPLYTRLVSFFQAFNVRHGAFTVVAGGRLLEEYPDIDRPMEETVPRLYWPNFPLDLREDSCTGDDVRLLFVGYLIERKGCRYFLEAVAELAKTSDRRITASVVGSGDQEDSLRALAADLGIADAVDFAGYLPNGPELRAQFQRADIFVMPSFSGEGFPRVLYEAMSQTTPIITTNVCGIESKMKDGENGLVIAPQSSAEIAGAARQIIENPALRQSLIANSHAFMKALAEGKDGGAQIKQLIETHCLKQGNA